MDTTIHLPSVCGAIADHHNEELRTMAELKICALHEDLSDVVTSTGTVITKTSNDVGWIKNIAWAILLAAIAATGSIWGLFYPYMTRISDKVYQHDASLHEMAKQLSYQERADEESKMDRKEMRVVLTEIRNMIHEAHKDKR